MRETVGPSILLNLTPSSTAAFCFTFAFEDFSARTVVPPPHISRTKFAEVLDGEMRYIEFGSLRIRVQTLFRPSDSSQYVVVARTPHSSSQVLSETILTRNHPETHLRSPTLEQRRLFQIKPHHKSVVAFPTNFENF